MISPFKLKLWAGIGIGRMSVKYRDYKKYGSFFCVSDYGLVKDRYLMDIKKQSWALPSKEDGQAFVIRSQAAEKDLCSALDLLHHVKESIPHTPASNLKGLINNFLTRYKS